jgi:transcriptional regulator with XRE-family HTH domain
LGVASRFPKQIRNAMEEQGLSQQAVATLAGVTPSQLSRFLAGKADLTSSNLERVAIAVGLTLVAPPTRPRKDRTPAKRTN